MVLTSETLLMTYIALVDNEELEEEEDIEDEMGMLTLY